MKLFRKFSRYVFYAFLLFPFCIGCVKKLPDANKIKELVFVVNLVNDESKVAEYLEYHKKIWPEVEAGFKKAGYKNITPYITNRSSGLRRFTFDHLFIPNPGALFALEHLIHEWMGYLTYQLKGYV